MCIYLSLSLSPSPSPEVINIYIYTHTYIYIHIDILWFKYTTTWDLSNTHGDLTSTTWGFNSNKLGLEQYTWGFIKVPNKKWQHETCQPVGNTTRDVICFCQERGKAEKKISEIYNIPPIVVLPWIWHVDSVDFPQTPFYCRAGLVWEPESFNCLTTDCRDTWWILVGSRNYHWWESRKFSYSYIYIWSFMSLRPQWYPFQYIQ